HKALPQHVPRLIELSDKYLQDTPHLHPLCSIVQLSLANSIQAEHQEPVERHQFIVRMHAPDKLVALPVAETLHGRGCNVVLDNLEIGAHVLPLASSSRLRLGTMYRCVWPVKGKGRSEQAP